MSLATSTTYAPFTITSFPLLPLPTTFTRPADCEGIHVLDGDVFVVGKQRSGDSFPSSCYPPGFATEDTAFFSPGFECPSGYWKACSGTGVAAQSNAITTITCCPHYNSASLSCVLDPWGLTNQWSNQFCTWQAPAGGSLLTVTKSTNGRTLIETASLDGPPAGLNAYGIRMVYQSSDIQAASATSQTTSTTSTGPPDDSNQQGDQGGGLSTGAVVAIAVVIPVVVIGAAIGFFLWRKSRRARSSPSDGQSMVTDGKYHYASSPNYTNAPPNYTYAPMPNPQQYHQGHAELPATQTAHSELAAEPQRYELR